MNITDTHFYTNLIGFTFFALILGLFSFFLYLIYKTYKNEKAREEFEPTIKQGDKIYFPVMSGSLNGEILEVKDNKVIITVEVSKSRVYKR